MSWLVDVETINAQQVEYEVRENKIFKGTVKQLPIWIGSLKEDNFFLIIFFLKIIIVKWYYVF